MAKIIPFRSAQALARQQLEEQAAVLIEAMGSDAGYRVGCIARLADVDDIRRARLLALAEEIDRRQGFGWHFAENEVSSGT